jgi:quinol monooxygenase YgiN
LSNWRVSAATRKGRSASPPIKKSSDRTFVLLEIWTNAAARTDFENRNQTKRLLERIQPLLEVPFDEPPGTLIE